MSSSWEDLLVRPAVENGRLVLTCTAFFFVLQYVSHRVSMVLSSSYRALSDDLKADWCVRIAAAVHSLVAWGAIPQFFYPLEGMREDLYFFSPRQQAFFSWSTGYFVYDLFVCCYYRWGAAFIVHGAACLPVFFFSLHPFLHYYGGYFLGMFEVSTVPLHIRALMETCGRNRGFLFQFLTVCFFLSFTFCRIIGGYYVCYLWWGDMVALLRSGAAHSNFVVCYYLFANTVLVGLSTYWWFGMLHVAFCDRSKSKTLGRGRGEIEAEAAKESAAGKKKD